MKRHALITVSLAANAALAGYVLFKAPAPPASRDTASAHASVNSAPPQASVHSREGISTALHNNDHVALRDWLKASGFPDDMVRDIVSARIWKRYEERVKAITPPPAPKNHWWKESYNLYDDSNEPTTAQFAELQAAQREAEDEQRRVLGADLNPGTNPLAAFLSPEKCTQIQKIEQDYRELRDEIQQSIRGFTLPSDLEKLRLLDEEQKRDIYAVMTPEEQKAYELRLSPTAQTLRWDMSRFDVSEAEYLKIFELQKAFDGKHQNNDPFAPLQTEIEIDWEQRGADELKLKQQIRALIGEDRYAQALKVQDQDYRLLKDATRRFDLPADTPDRIYALRGDIDARVKQIGDNPRLSVEAKKKALIELAAQTRSQVQNQLGPEVSAAYLKNNMGWLKALDDGNPISFSPETTDWTILPIEAEPSPSAPE